MSDILPKAKTYILISIFQMLINIGAWVFNVSLTDFNNYLLSFGVGVGGAFLPGVSLVNLAFLNLPEFMTIIIGVFTGIFTGVQAFLLVVMIMQMVRNLLWQPDV